MEPRDVREAIRLLKEQVTLTQGPAGNCEISFVEPDRDGMVQLGISPGVAARFAAAPWWSEMVEDVLETPDFCEPDASPDEILQYARDVIFEYVAKRS